MMAIMGKKQDRAVPDGHHRGTITQIGEYELNFTATAAKPVEDFFEARLTRTEIIIYATGTAVGRISTFVPFSMLSTVGTFIFEQFWGRAAQASRDSNESRRLFFCLFIASAPLSATRVLALV
jgi:hypothetical protein